MYPVIVSHYLMGLVSTRTKFSDKSATNIEKLCQLVAAQVVKLSKKGKVVLNDSSNMNQQKLSNSAKLEYRGS